MPLFDLGEKRQHDVFTIVVGRDDQDRDSDPRAALRGFERDSSEDRHGPSFLELVTEILGGLLGLFIGLAELVVRVVLCRLPPGQPVFRLGAAVGLGQFVEGALEEGLDDRILFFLKALDEGVDGLGFLVDPQAVDHDPANRGVLVIEGIVEMLVEDRVIHLGEGDGHALANRAVLVLLEGLDHLVEYLVAGGGGQRLDGAIPVEPGHLCHDLYEHAELALFLGVHLGPRVVANEGVGRAKSFADRALADAFFLAPDARADKQKSQTDRRYGEGWNTERDHGIVLPGSKVKKGAASRR